MKTLATYRLKILKELFNTHDNDYRILLESYYKNHDLNDNTILLLYLLCAHQNINTIYDEVNETSGRWYNDNIFNIFDNLINNYDLPVIDECDNDIKYKLNSMQDTALAENNYQIKITSAPDCEGWVETNVCKIDSAIRENKRSLVLYFRRESIEESEVNEHTIQMDYFEFVLICRTLSLLIQNDDHRYFDCIKIISREPNLYPHYTHNVISDIIYKNVSGVDFFKECYFRANTIYFMNGAEILTPGTIPIYANNMKLQNPVNVRKHIDFDVSYYMNNNDDFVFRDGEILTIEQAAKLAGYKKHHTIDHIITKTVDMYKRLTDELLSCIN